MAKAATMTTATRPQAAPKRQKKAAETVYTVVVMREKDGHYVGYAPALCNCGSMGDTLPEALRMTEEAIWLYLQTQRKHGWPIPPDDPRVCVDMSQIAEASLYRLTIREAPPGA
jgi:predicted RNase H-like HicB family nuclease